MRISKVLLLVPVMLLAFAGVTYAAFDNSHHDMRTYTSGATKEGCFQCHGRASLGSFTVQTGNFGNVGGLCLQRCHTGTGILASNNQLVPTTPPSVNPATYAVTAGTLDFSTVYFANSHNRVPGSLLNGVGGAAVSWPPTAAATWPYMAAATNLECTSCHAVHDAANAPFLWSPLGPSGAGAFDGFCDKCHSESARSGGSLTGAGAAPNGNHPINFVMDNTATGALGRTGSGRRARRIFVQDYGTTTGVFDIAAPAATAMINATSAATAWNLGGHIANVGTPGAQAAAAITAIPGTGISTGVLGCFTCHSAHRGVVNNENNLVNVATMDNTNWNPLCVGCHGSQATLAGDQNDWRVGGSTAFGHPVGTSSVRDSDSNYTSSIGGFKFRIATPTYTNGQNGNQIGNGGALMCTSCHKVHGGVAATMALANIGQGTSAICKGCHTGVGIPNVGDVSKGGTVDNTTNRANMSNQHHVTRTAFSAANNLGKVGDTTTLINIATPSWVNTPKTGLGDYASGMDCADCHTFNGTAHNW